MTMMSKGLLVDWKTTGALLANADDDEQAKFFKTFVNECLSWDSFYQAQAQLAMVNKKLDERDKRLLSMLSYPEGEN